VLAAGEHAVAAQQPAPDDDLLAAELSRLDRKLAAIDGERRRLVDLYQAGLLELPEMQRRAADAAHRSHDLKQRREALTAERHELARGNQLRQRVRDFATRVLAVIDTLDFNQKQILLRLVVAEVRVTGWHVQIQLRIPLDDQPGGSPPPSSNPGSGPSPPVSTEDRLRSLSPQRMRQVHLRPRGRQRVRRPIPAVSRLQDNLRVLTRPGQLGPQPGRAIGDPDGAQQPRAGTPGPGVLPVPLGGTYGEDGVPVQSSYPLPGGAVPGSGPSGWDGEEEEQPGQERWRQVREQGQQMHGKVGGYVR
jgi:hypothetical protein